MTRTPTVAAGIGLLLILSACTPDQPNTSGTPTPEDGDQIESQTVEVREEDFQIQLTLDAKTVNGPAVPLSTNPQFIVETQLADGAHIRKGQKIGMRRIDPQLKDALQVASKDNRIDRNRLRELKALEGPVIAPVAGVFEESTATIIAPGTDVVVELNPIQQLRLRALEYTGTVKVETVAGDRAVPCETLWTNAQPAASNEDEPGSNATLRCRLPAHIETAPGLPARLQISTATQRDATIVPNYFVTYDNKAQSFVVTIDLDAGPKRVPVDLGPTDGIVRVVTSELPVGATLVEPQAGPE